ncbi:MAG: hypothetical protein AUH15_01965 [Acidobacteriales bacterium 13_2_20CM_55_8]|nr:MAG: hypothetical protein AUH15_01965 [Acidobacteriales bacterium 13_2_20CM_55_8]
MKRAPLTFLVAGLIAGIATVAIGRVWPAVLINDVGLLFFVALLAAITVSASSSRVRRGLWRYLVGLIICAAAYLGGLFAFSVAAGYSPDLLGMPASSAMPSFGTDVWIGLLVATLVSSACIELLASVLTGRWSNRFFLFLTAVGFVTVAATYTAHVLFRKPWTFLGVLLPIGEALFCWVLGQQIWESGEGTTVRTPAGL